MASAKTEEMDQKPVNVTLAQTAPIVVLAQRLTGIQKHRASGAAMRSQTPSLHPHANAIQAASTSVIAVPIAPSFVIESRVPISRQCGAIKRIITENAPT